MTIRYSVGDSPLGRVLVAATDRGVCFLCLGDEDATVVHALREEFPAVEIERDDVGLMVRMDAVLAYLSGAQVHLDLPLDVRGTAFQHRVWEALQAIPYGETRTYAQIAEGLGYSRSAARAVGRACATNPVSLMVPCHRAMRGDGGLAGYAWGLKRKRALQALERGNR